MSLFISSYLLLLYFWKSSCNHWDKLAVSESAETSWKGNSTQESSECAWNEGILIILSFTFSSYYWRNKKTSWIKEESIWIQSVKNIKKTFLTQQMIITCSGWGDLYKIHTYYSCENSSCVKVWQDSQVDVLWKLQSWFKHLGNSYVGDAWNTACEQ